MSLFGGQQPQVVVPPQPATNGLGVAGFICSLVGLLVTGGLLSPVGLILSLAALGRQPRGFAVAGVIIGLIGSCWLVGVLFAVILFGIGAVLAAAGIAVAVALSEPEKVEITSDMVNIALAIKAYEKENAYLPASLGLLDIKPVTRMDPWGNAYEYHLTEEDPGFEIVSAGEDGQFGTVDDVRFTALGETWEAGGFGVEVDEDAGTVRIRVGESTFTAAGDDAGGRISIDLGDRVIEIVGDEEGGGIDVEPRTPPAGENAESEGRGTPSGD